MTLLYINPGEAKRFLATYRPRHLMFHEDRLTLLNQIMDDSKVVRVGRVPFVELPGSKVQTAFCDGSHHEGSHSHASCGVSASEQAHADAGNGKHGRSGILVSSQYVRIIIDPTTSGTPALIIAQQKNISERLRSVSTQTTYSDGPGTVISKKRHDA